MSELLAELQKRITPGTIIPKPQAKADFIVKGWGIRRGERALIYTIPNHNNPARPYLKGITASEWDLAFTQLRATGDFSSAWFQRAMAACAKEGSCNFTTIGGILQLLGYAVYSHGAYRAGRHPH
jgi:hypothetical protein